VQEENLRGDFPQQRFFDARGNARRQRVRRGVGFVEQEARGDRGQPGVAAPIRLGFFPPRGPAFVRVEGERLAGDARQDAVGAIVEEAVRVQPRLDQAVDQRGALVGQRPQHLRR
jgi:hypothetical protein